MKAIFRIYHNSETPTMDFKFIIFLACVTFSAFCNLPIRGKDLAKHVELQASIKREGSIQGRHLSSSTSTSSATYGPLYVKPIDHFTHFAAYFSNGEWHGVRAKINAWKVNDVQPLSNTSTFIAATNYEVASGEVIAAGIHVYPSLYKNSDVRFFTYWTSNENGRITGCYNDNCPGFVIADGANLLPGQALAPPFSTYGGDEHYTMIRIKKDEDTGDWSLYREDMGGPIDGMTLLGWWPKNLFKHLSDTATQIQWSGAVSYHYDEKSPSMGSGSFSVEGEGKSAYFKNILAFDSNGNRYDPDPKDVVPYMDKEECYDVSNWEKGKHDGRFFYYGGPSGCADK